MTNQSPKQMFLEQFARIGKAISSGTRIEMLEFLAQGEKNVETLAGMTKSTVANTSQHLQQLRQVGLVTSRKDGQRVYYRLADETAVELMMLVRKIAERNIAEVEQLINLYLKSKDSFEAVPAEELIERVKTGAVIIFDVRPPDEYAAGHVPGALNVPFKDLEKHIHKLNSKAEVIAYCRGPYCLLAYDAVAKLREKNFKARRLEDGFPEWKRRGFPVEKGKKE